MNFWQQINTILMIIVAILAYTVPVVVISAALMILMPTYLAILCSGGLWVASLFGWRYWAWSSYQKKETEDQEFDRLRAKYFSIDEPCFMTLDELRDKERI